MVFAPEIATRLQPFFGHRSATRLVLGARALRSPPARFDPASRWQALRTMLGEFASREVAGLPVTLRAQSGGDLLASATVMTDGEGFAHFDLTLTRPWPLPDAPRWDSVALHWENAAGAQSTLAQVLAPGVTGGLAVISDIDDTVIETGITGGWRNLARNMRRVVAHLPHERDAVAGAAAFFRALAGEAGETTGQRPVFYVSSSPWNLFPYLLAYKQLHRLPLGPLTLRDWGLGRSTLGSSSHGAHKIAAIAAIIAMHPALRFVLVGDDTQGDLPAFAKAAHNHPGRIAGVFLRRTARAPLAGEKAAARAMLEALGVPFWSGEDFAGAEAFLRDQGLVALADEKLRFPPPAQS